MALVTPKTAVVMSGMRATGHLHLGHYFGVLQNWVALQEHHPCFFMVADWHSLTTRFEDTQELPHFRESIVLDWLAAGLDPGKTTIYFQSALPQIAELHLLLSMVTPNKWCETDPTLKDMVQHMKQGQGELHYGLLGYPVLQTADILSVGGSLVPVGKDQEAHLEISRDIARRVNHISGQEVFVEPKPLFTETPSLSGLDGRKMSKSYRNTIALSATEDETAQAIKTGITDAARIRKDDPGTPENCAGIFPWYHLFAPQEVVAQVAQECRQGTRGCMACKKQLIEAVNEGMAPLRERRATYAQDMAQVHRIITTGNTVARERAESVMQHVRRAFNIQITY